jgi:hypothetical protein
MCLGSAECRFSVPAYDMAAASRAAAVRDGRFLRPPAGLVLDGREHGARFGQAWDAQPHAARRSAAFLCSFKRSMFR